MHGAEFENRTFYLHRSNSSMPPHPPIHLLTRATLNKTPSLWLPCRLQSQQRQRLASSDQSVSSFITPQKSQSQPAATSQAEPINEEDFSPQPNYIQPTKQVLSVFGRVFLYTGVVSISIAVLAYLGFEGAHLYVEHVAIPASTPSPGENEDEDSVWGWSASRERWTGGKRGGTDPALGWKARHLLRAAWMAQNWGAGTGSHLDEDGLPRRSAAGGTGYHLAEQFLALTVAQAERTAASSPSSSSSLSSSLVDIITLHARVLERVGSPESLSKARGEYLRLWEGLSTDVVTHVDAARVAIKIGDLSGRLEDAKMAEEWWMRAIEYTTLSGGRETSAGPRLQSPPPSDLPAALPPSPIAQRTLVSALLSLSSFYAKTHQLDRAQTVEQSALNLLSTSWNQHVLNIDSQSLSPGPHNAPATLHSLYMAHRSSVLSMQLAEVLYATRSASPAKSKFRRRKTEDVTSPSQIQLHLAATASERVAHALTSTPQPYSGVPSATTHALAPTYSENPSLVRPASNLLRDARRTAAEAWNLSGLLYELEDQDDAQTKALQCFERAVHWAGGLDTHTGRNTDVIQQEWQMYWSNYKRARERVEAANPVHIA